MLKILFQHHRVMRMETNPNQVQILRIDLQKIDLLQYVKKDELLWKSLFFTGLDESTKISLLASGHVRTAKDKEVIFRQAPTREIFMILDGSIVLSINEGTIDLMTLSKGDFFGLTSVFKNAPLVQATAVSNETRMAIFPGDMVTSLAASNEPFGRNLAHHAKNRSIRARECADFMDKW